MESRNLACLLAAGFLGVGLTTVAASADARPIVVEGERFNPELQRRVSYADLNLAVRPDQQTLQRRIQRTASGLCRDLDQRDFHENFICTSDAVRSTDSQVSFAIARAKDKLAGRPVGPAIAITMVAGSR